MNSISPIRSMFARFHVILGTLLLFLPLAVWGSGMVASWGDNSWGQTTLPVGVDNIKAVAAGWRHTLALKTDGTVLAWGYDGGGGSATIPAGLSNVVAISAMDMSGVLKADGTIAVWGAFDTDMHTTGVSDVTALAVGWYHWLALKSDGSLVTWGVGANSVSPTNLPPNLTNVTAIAAGIEFSMALKSDGTVACWGSGTYGVNNVPAGLSNVVAIAAGFDHALALKNDGTVVGWGANFCGEATPPAGLSNVVAIAGGAYDSLALKADGTVVAWGSADVNGQFQAVVPSSLRNVRAISAGEGHNVALVFDGPVQITRDLAPASLAISNNVNLTYSIRATGDGPLSYHWMLNGSLLENDTHRDGTSTDTLFINQTQFGDSGFYTVLVSNALGSVLSSSSELEIIKPPYITGRPPSPLKVGAGSNLGLSVTALGTTPLYYQWFYNGLLLSGEVSPVFQLNSIQTSQAGLYSLLVTNAYGSTNVDIEVVVTNTRPTITLQPVSQSGAIGGNANFLVTANGSIPLAYQWRFNGQNISGATRSSLVLTNLTMAQAGYYDAAVSNIAGSVVSAKALLTIGQSSVFIWGYAPPYTTTPVPAGLTNVIALAGGNFHLSALKRDGTVAAWFATPYIYSPQITNVPASVTNVVAISAAQNSTMALRANGSVVLWGDTGLSSVPSGASNAVAIADGGDHALVLKNDGSIFGWGNNNYGQCNSPSGLSNVVAIAAGYYYSLALKSDGTVTSWGSPTFWNQTNAPTNVVAISASSSGALTSAGLLADGTIYYGTTSPIRAGNLSNMVAVAVSQNLVAGLRTDGLMQPYLQQANFPVAVSNVIALATVGSQYLGTIVSDGTPYITVQPASQVTTNGGTVRLHVRGSGAQPVALNSQTQQLYPKGLAYQWQFNGLNLARETNADLTITNAQGANTGNYVAIVSNALGRVTSFVAKVTFPFNTNLASALDATNLVWKTSSTNAPWFAQIAITHGDPSAAQSGHLGDNQRSVLQTQVAGPGSLSFWWKVSSEEGYDFLRFYVDSTNGAPLGGISGEVDWQQLTFSLSAGTHTLYWIYSKDVSVSTGQDAGWLDQVTFVGGPLILQQPKGGTVWMGSSVTLAAKSSVDGQAAAQWLKDGAALPNASSTVLTLTNVTRADSGSYCLQVANDTGIAVSSNAVIRVLVPQKLGPPLRLPDGSIGLSSMDADGRPLPAGSLSAFEVQVSSNLVDWSPLPCTSGLTNGCLNIRDLAGTNYPARFYRVVEH